MKTVVFFNNKGGVGKTSLVYHLAWMYADLGVSVLAADFDPQANLSAMFLREERLEELWPDGEHPDTVLGSLRPMLRGVGDIRSPHVEPVARRGGIGRDRAVGSPHVEPVAQRLGVLVGDLGLSEFEAKLSTEWNNCLAGSEAAFRAISAFHRMMVDAAGQQGADLVLIDVGPNLGAINRSAIIAANFVVVPLAADLFSLQGLRIVGPSLNRWRQEWRGRLDRRPSDPNLLLPAGDMLPIGYVILLHPHRLDRPVRAYENWMKRIPPTYLSEVLSDARSHAPSIDRDPNCLATLKNYRSLMPLAQDALKPMFHLKAGDGALGGHLNAVQGCFEDFRRLARAIAEKCDVKLP
jgi:cellulose biosynthesis protein BcsQ